MYAIRVELGEMTQQADKIFVKFSAPTSAGGHSTTFGDNKWAKNVLLPITLNAELATTMPSIGADTVENFIKTVEVTTLGEKTTVVRAILRNGFEIVESSSCVSKENYSVKLGKEICMKKIRDKVWMLLGFLLQTAVNGFDYGEAEA